jgi:hypothetical protein
MLNDAYEFEYGLHWWGPDKEKMDMIEKYTMKNMDRIKRKYVTTTRVFNDFA